MAIKISKFLILTPDCACANSVAMTSMLSDRLYGHVNRCLTIDKSSVPNAPEKPSTLLVKASLRLCIGVSVSSSVKPQRQHRQ